MNIRQTLAILIISSLHLTISVLTYVYCDNVVAAVVIYILASALQLFFYMIFSKSKYSVPTVEKNANITKSTMIKSEHVNNIADSANKFADVEFSYDIYTHDDEEVLTNLIMSASEEKAKNNVRQLMSRIPLNNREMLNYLVMNIIRTFIKLISNVKIDDDKDKYKFEDLLGIIKLDSSLKMEHELLCIVSALCADIERIKPSAAESVGKRVMTYVEENYSNRDLDVSMISDYLNFSPSYAIKLFKAETGEGISGYINRVRVEKAKELLFLDIYKIEQISKMVGFSDSRGLSRSFKTIYGVTPSQYKEIALLEKNN